MDTSILIGPGTGHGALQQQGSGSGMAQDENQKAQDSPGPVAGNYDEAEQMSSGEDKTVKHELL